MEERQNRDALGQVNQQMRFNFETKVKPLLLYVGTVGAVLMAIAYVAIVLIMVFGFSASKSFTQTLVFALVNAVIGLVIMQLLKIQGIDFAKEIEENQATLKKYNEGRHKTKKYKGMTYFWITSSIKDVAIKGFTVIFTTFGIIYIIIQGSNDYSLLLLAIVNIIMFVCFGLLALVKAYNYFNDEYIPYIKECINEREQEELKRKAEADMALAEKELNKQVDPSIYLNRGSDILDTGLDSCVISDHRESVVLDCSGSGDSVLVWTTDTCGSAADSFNSGAKETI